MIQSLIQMVFAPDKIDDAMQILLSIVERIRAEIGCVSCSVYKDTEMESQIIFTQVWKSENDLQRHLRSDEYKKVLLVMEMASARPEIRFDNIVSTSGVETIEKARHK
jgi:quinol monooxygenase YgiN